MKTVRKGEDIRRLKDEDADAFVKSRGYEYVPKSVWRESQRVVLKPSEDEMVEEKETKKKRKKGERSPKDLQHR